jgi:hypothetical protein
VNTWAELVLIAASMTIISVLIMWFIILSTKDRITLIELIPESLKIFKFRR